MPPPDALTLADKLAMYLQACAAMPFSWGRWNCAHFAGTWVQVATGRAVAPAAGPDDGPRPWARQLQQAGGMRRLVSALLGAPWHPAGLAQDGDVVTLPGRIVPEALGIRVGDRIACVGAPAGVAWQPAGQATACWRLAEVPAQPRLGGGA